MNSIKSNLSLILLAAILASCSFVTLNPQAKSVTVIPNANAVSNCKFLGNTNVSLWSKAGTFQSTDKIESQLDILARNEAAGMGGNTVTPNSPINNNQRAYSVYNCPNQ